MQTQIIIMPNSNHQKAFIGSKTFNLIDEIHSKKALYSRLHWYSRWNGMNARYDLEFSSQYFDVHLGMVSFTKRKRSFVILKKWRNIVLPPDMLLISDNHQKLSSNKSDNCSSLFSVLSALGFLWSEVLVYRMTLHRNFRFRTSPFGCSDRKTHRSKRTSLNIYLLYI